MIANIYIYIKLVYKKRGRDSGNNIMRYLPGCHPERPFSAKNFAQ